MATLHQPSLDDIFLAHGPSVPFGNAHIFGPYGIVPSFPVVGPYQVQGLYTPSCREESEVKVVQLKPNALEEKGQNAGGFGSSPDRSLQEDADTLHRTVVATHRRIPRKAYLREASLALRGNDYARYDGVLRARLWLWTGFKV